MAQYKPLSNSQIDDVVSDFLGRHPDRSAQIDQAIAGQQKAASAAAAPAAAGRAAAAATGGNRGANPGTQGGSPLSGITDFIRGVQSLSGGSIGDQLSEKQGVDQAPANPVQWALNALSTPVYMAGEAAHNLAANPTTGKVQSLQETAQQSAKDSKAGLDPRRAAMQRGEDSFDPVGAVGRAAGVAGGLGKGLAEGLGFRFGGERARTLGDMTAEAGVNKAVGDTARAAGASEPVAKVAEGATGFAADLAVPVPGIGAIRGAAAGVKGAAAAAKAGEGAAATARGFSAGKAAYEAQVVAKQASRAAAKVARKATKKGGGLSGAEGVAADAAARAQERAGAASADADVASAAASVGDSAGAEAAARSAHSTSREVSRFEGDGTVHDAVEFDPDDARPGAVDIGHLIARPAAPEAVGGTAPRLALPRGAGEQAATEQSERVGRYADFMDRQADAAETRTANRENGARSRAAKKTEDPIAAAQRRIATLEAHPARPTDTEAVQKLHADVLASERANLAKLQEKPDAAPGNVQFTGKLPTDQQALLDKMNAAAPARPLVGTEREAAINSAKRSAAPFVDEHGGVTAQGRRLEESMPGERGSAERRQAVLDAFGTVRDGEPQQMRQLRGNLIGGGYTAEERAAIPGLAKAGPAGQKTSEQLAAESVEQLLPKLNRKAGAGTVDAQGILEHAAGPDVRPALITTSQHAELTRAVVDADSVQEAKAAIAAVAKTKGGRELLAKQIGFDGKQITVGQLLERAYMRRLTGDSAEYAQLQPFVERILNAGATVKRGQMSADSLAVALADGVGSGDNVDTASLLTRLMAAKPADRPGILKDVLNASAPEGGAQFGDFSEAMEAAIGGDVSPQQMRLMLTALGIQTRATAEGTLRKLLGGTGVKRWSEVQAAIPSKVEVTAAHGFDQDAMAAAEATNVEAVQRAAAADAVEAADRADEALPEPATPAAEDPAAPLTVQPSPLTTPGRAQGIGDSLAEILQRYNLDPLNQDVNGLDAWRHLATQILNVVTFPANVKKLEGAARGEYLYGKLMNRLNAGEAYLRSHGVMPAFKGGDRTWYFSFGQVLEHLDEGTVKQAFFDLRYRLGEGQTPAQRELYKQGLTVFPSSFAKGTVAAIRGGDEDAILRAMQTGRGSKFTESPEGAAALKRVARDMASPGYADTMRTLHEGQEVIALAFANRAADELIGPMASKFIEAVASYGDRSAVTHLIREAAETAAKIKTEGNSSLLRELYTQRSTNGLLGMLNDAEGATVRADLRAAHGESVAKQQEDVFTAEHARVAARRVDEGRAPAAAPKHAAEEQTHVRNDQASNAHQLLDEQDDLAAETVEELHQPGMREDTDLARVETLIEVQQAMTRGKRVFDKVGVLFDGFHGMQDAKSLISQFMTGSHVASELYQKKMVEWAVGDPRLLAKNVAPGIQARLEAAIGRPASYTELHDFTRQWWTALAGHVTRDPGADDDALRSLLAEGAAGDLRNGLPEVPPLPPEQVEMAIELKGLIDDVFTAADGPLARAQAGSDVVRRELSRYGVKDGKMPDRGVNMSTQAGLWKTFDFSAEGSTPPLDTLLTWHRALEAATVPQSVGNTFAKLLDHKASGLSPAEAKAAGWKRLDTKQEDRLISAHVPADSYFPPEAIAQLPYAEHLLQQAQKASIGSPEFQKFVVAPFDYITGILKASQTIWRPAHHVTNVSGELLINTMAGVNPKYALQVPKTLKALGLLQDVGDDVLDALAREHVPDLQAAAGDTGDIGARVTVRGQVVELTHAQIAQLGLARGALVTARQARDALPGSEVSSALGREGAATFRRLNPLAHVDGRLGEFSATRDNATRVPHFIHELESRSYGSLDEAVARSAEVVQKYHPTIASLSNFEQKYVRRAIYFYTWMRLTAGVVLQHAVERPKDVTAIQEAQYELASANGLNPNSIGNPTPTDDPRVPTYASQGLLGPTYQAGLSPFGDASEPDQFGDTAHLWGFSISAPQIDAITGMFQGNPVTSSNPLIGVPVELALNAQPNSAVKPLDDPGAFLLQQSGAPYSIASSLGYSTKDAPKDADATELAEFDASQKGNQARSALNYLTGAKFTDYTSLANQRNAASESSQILRQQLTDQGYSDSDIDTLVRQQSKLSR